MHYANNLFGLAKQKKEWRRAALEWSREDLHTGTEIKEKAAISRLSADDQTGPEQQMEKQKAVMVYDISPSSVVFFGFVLFS